MKGKAEGAMGGSAAKAAGAAATAGEGGASASGRRVVVGEPSAAGSLRLRDGEGAAAFLLGALGAAFLIVGLVDLGLLWSALDFGNVAWEYSTLSRTLDSVPMGGLGLGLLTAAVLWSPGRRGGGLVRTLSVVFLLGVAAFLVMGALYATAVPEMVRQTTGPALEGLERAVVRNSVEVVVYAVVFGAVGLRLWRTVEKGT